MDYNFNKILQIIYKKSPLQKKKIEKYLFKQDKTFFKSAEKFSLDYLSYLESQNILLEYAVDAYLKMCGNMLKSQIYFMKTDKYPVEQAVEVFENVYDNEKVMKSFMIGLALSQFLWPTHYEMYSFFKATLRNSSNSISSYLEIGPGHGLFLSEAMQSLKNDVKFVAVDISPISIKITQSIMEHFYNNQSSKITYYNIDMLELDLNDKYDFITMGEILEHVNCPEELLCKVKDLLTARGQAFISTCVNCPTIDHVYHFKHVDEIRKMLDSSGFLIKNERVLPVENFPIEEIVGKKITINYCAAVTQKNKN